MPHSALIRPIRAAEAAQAKHVVFQVAHELMEPATPFDAFQARWDGWGVFNDLHNIDEEYLAQAGEFYVVEAEGRIVGTGGFRRDAAPGYCELKRIALLPAYRGLGLGYALLKELLQRAQTKGYANMILWTNRFKLARAVELYRQLGFIEVLHADADPEDIWMEIELTPPASPTKG